MAVTRWMVPLGGGPASISYTLASPPRRCLGAYIGGPEAAAPRGRGESGCSAKGEKAEIRGFVDGLKPRGARTAIIFARVFGRRHEQPRWPGQSSQAGRIGSRFARGRLEGAKTGGRQPSPAAATSIAARFEEDPTQRRTGCLRSRERPRLRQCGIAQGSEEGGREV